MTVVEDWSNKVWHLWLKVLFTEKYTDYTNNQSRFLQNKIPSA